MDWHKLLHRLTWTFLQMTYGFYLWLRHRPLRIQGDLRPFRKGGCLVVANHLSSIDPWILAARIPPVSYIANEDGLRDRFFKLVRTFMVGALPKRKGMSDPAVVPEVIRRVRAGRHVGIFLEGDQSWHGKTDPIIPGIGKLVKICRSPVAIVVLRGPYMCHPRYRKKGRRGPVYIDVKWLMPEDVKSMNPQQIIEALQQGIEHDELKDPLLADKSYPEDENLAEGLEQMLWKCPSCNALNTIKTTGTMIHCTACGMSTKLSQRYQIDKSETGYDNIGQWYRWQIDVMEHDFADTSLDTVVLADEAVKRLQGDVSAAEAQEIAQGRLWLTHNTLFFDAENGEDKLVIPVAEITGVVDQFKVRFEIVHAAKRYRFVLGKTVNQQWVSYVRKARAIEQHREDAVTQQNS